MSSYCFRLSGNISGFAKPVLAKVGAPRNDGYLFFAEQPHAQYYNTAVLVFGGVSGNAGCAVILYVSKNDDSAYHKFDNLSTRIFVTSSARSHHETVIPGRASSGPGIKS